MMILGCWIRLGPFGSVWIRLDPFGSVWFPVWFRLVPCAYAYVVGLFAGGIVRLCEALSGHLRVSGSAGGQN